MKYFLSKFRFLRAYFSPFKPPKVRLYIGKVTLGTPYFFPRRWVNDKSKPGYLKAVKKHIGFDFVSLGWKSKWHDTDYRFEWGPMWSFVFFGLQIALSFNVDEPDHYWPCWLYYVNNTNKSDPTEERIAQSMEDFPCIWISHKKTGTERICYWYQVLKKKWVVSLPSFELRQ